MFGKRYGSADFLLWRNLKIIFIFVLCFLTLKFTQWNKNFNKLKLCVCFAPLQFQNNFSILMYFVQFEKYHV